MLQIEISKEDTIIVKSTLQLLGMDGSSFENDSKR